MRKYKTYLGKTGRVPGGLLWLAVLCLLLPSCTGDDVLPDTDGTCTVTLRLNVSSFGSRGTDGMTRTVAGNSDEDLVKDLWVFQFSATTDSLLRNPVYIGEGSLNGIDEIDVDFVQNGPGDSSVVCVVANTHDSNWATDENDQVREGFATYTAFQKQTLPEEVSRPFLSAVTGATGGYTIPMYGMSRIAIAAKSYIRVPLVRMFARVYVLVDPAYPFAHHMTVKSVTYSHVPLYSRIKEITAKDEYPEGVEWKDYVEEGAVEFTLYIPENIQGVVEEMDGKATADPSLFPANALAIKIDLTHDTMAEGGDDGGDIHVHEYTVYPGGDMKNDFNIRRNYIYNVTIKLISEPDKDTIVP